MYSDEVADVTLMDMTESKNLSDSQLVLVSDPEGASRPNEKRYTGVERVLVRSALQARRKDVALKE